MRPDTEFEFTLPHGYVDDSGEVHRHGRMRMARALDEIEAVNHPLVLTNEAYLPVVLLSRVITHLGSLTTITPKVIEDLYAADVAYLEDLYLQVNAYEGLSVRTTCPHCRTELQIDLGSRYNSE
ncbi:MAG: phage tail assembly protein [Anaerolineae bacterium]